MTVIFGVLYCAKKSQHFDAANCVQLQYRQTIAVRLGFYSAGSWLPSTSEFPASTLNNSNNPKPIMVGGAKWSLGCSNRLGAVPQIHSESFKVKSVTMSGFVKHTKLRRQSSPSENILLQHLCCQNLASEEYELPGPVGL